MLMHGGGQLLAVHTWIRRNGWSNKNPRQMPRRCHLLGVGLAVPTLTLDVLDRRIELLQEFFLAVTDAVQVGAETGYDLDNPTGFFDLLVTYSTQRRLRCVKGDSILTVTSLLQHKQVYPQTEDRYQ